MSSEKPKNNKKRSLKELKIKVVNNNNTNNSNVEGGNTTVELNTPNLKPNNFVKQLFEKVYSEVDKNDSTSSANIQTIQENNVSNSSNKNNMLIGKNNDLDDDKDSGFKIKKLWLGRYEINVWYSAPYPEEYCKASQLFMCEFCLKYMKSSYICYRHMLKCKVRNPPGDEIYRENNLSVFEVDGRKNRIYCQNLCLLAKMFLDHKTLYYDVEPFLFYILTEVDKRGCHLVGYFSKEKRSTSGNNLSCILTLPNHQRKGYGSFLIDLSYLLSKKENKLGSPEKPLSNLGLLGYRSYWKNQIYQEILNLKDSSSFSLESLCYRLGMNADDVVSTLFINGILEEKDGRFILNVDVGKIEAHLNKLKSKKLLSAKAEHLRWSPFVNKLVPTAPSSSKASSESSSMNSTDNEDN